MRASAGTWALIALGCSASEVRVQHPPSAFAGFDGTVGAGDEVILDGSRSFDPDGDPLTYRWAIVGRPEGSAAGLDKSDQRFTRFVTDEPGSYLVALTVSDGALIDRDLVAMVATPTSTTAIELALEAEPLCQARFDRLFSSPCGISDRRVTVAPRVLSAPSGATALRIEWSYLRLPPQVSIADLSATSASPTGELDFVVPRPGEYWIGARLVSAESTSPLVITTIAVFDGDVEALPEPKLTGPIEVRRNERVLLDGRASVVPTASTAAAIDRRFTLQTDPSGEGRLEDVATGCPPGQCRLFYPSAPGTYLIGHQIDADGATSGTVVHAVEVR